MRASVAARYYRARYYHTDLQRLIIEDPIGLAAGDPNLYSYVGQNAINYVDPFGFEKDRRQCGGADC